MDESTEHLTTDEIETLALYRQAKAKRFCQLVIEVQDGIGVGWEETRKGRFKPKK